jgi:serine/threonine-protein kinase
LGEIASGGMATVFLGRVTGAKGFQRLVAIKRLHPHLESEEEFVSMFLDEARLAARIRHPNVVATLDVEDDEHLYIVMEYVEGDRLLAFLRHAAKSGEKIPPPIATRVAMDTLAALHAAHELTDDDGSPLGLVHRDVSPQNILISVDGSVKLVDFGIAKATARLSITRDGQLKGKIAYMAPEQTKRAEIDRRVDVFAMGIITWEMLTAKKLFNGESDVEVLNQLLFEPIPRLREVAPTVPASLDSVIARALERDPAKRFATALEFADALERASKIFGGPANNKVTAAYLQKVSGEKLAKDRARIAAGTPPVPENAGTPSGVKRRSTGQFNVPNSLPGAAIAPPAPPAPPPSPLKKPTMMGLGGPPAPRPSPSFEAGPSLLDDDEDVPTQAIVRADLPKANADANLDDGPTAAESHNPVAHSMAALLRASSPVLPTAQALPPLNLDEPTAVGMDGMEMAPGFNIAPVQAPIEPVSPYLPNASPRGITQQLPAARASIPPAPRPLDTPFDAGPTPFATSPLESTPTYEQPPAAKKSKVPLIAGLSVALLCLGGVGAAVVVKLKTAPTEQRITHMVAGPTQTEPMVQPPRTGTPPETRVLAPANAQPTNGATPTAVQPATTGVPNAQPPANTAGAAAQPANNAQRTQPAVGSAAQQPSTTAVSPPTAAVVQPPAQGANHAAAAAATTQRSTNTPRSTRGSAGSRTHRSSGTRTSTGAAAHTGSNNPFGEDNPYP